MRRLLIGTLAALLLAAGAGHAVQGKAVKVLIITGDHGHDWRRTTPFLKALLQKAGHQVDVTEAPGKDLTPENLARYDVLLLNYRNTPQGAKANPASVLWAGVARGAWRNPRKSSCFCWSTSRPIRSSRLWANSLT